MKEESDKEHSPTFEALKAQQSALTLDKNSFTTLLVNNRSLNKNFTLLETYLSKL